MRNLVVPAISLFLLLFLISCGRKDYIPPDVIGLEKMGDILLDMQEADAYNDNYVDTGYRVTDWEKRLKIFYGQILMIHDVDKKKFLDSYAFYESHPDLMQKMYKRMSAIVEGKKAHADSLATAEELQRNAIRRRTDLIKKFNSYKLPFRLYEDSIPSEKSRLAKPDQVHRPEVPDTALKLLKPLSH